MTPLRFRVVGGPWGLEFRVLDLRVWGLGALEFRIWGLDGSGVCGLRF